jgi:ssDNA-binding Zn-finger/Zn-ribbon topoisomerase 1
MGPLLIQIGLLWIPDMRHYAPLEQFPKGDWGDAAWKRGWVRCPQCSIVFGAFRTGPGGKYFQTSDVCPICPADSPDALGYEQKAETCITFICSANAKTLIPYLEDIPLTEPYQQASASFLLPRGVGLVWIPHLRRYKSPPGMYKRETTIPIGDWGDADTKSAWGRCSHCALLFISPNTGGSGKFFVSNVACPGCRNVSDIHSCVAKTRIRNI